MPALRLQKIMQLHSSSQPFPVPSSRPWLPRDMRDLGGGGKKDFWLPQTRRGCKALSQRPWLVSIISFSWFKSIY